MDFLAGEDMDVDIPSVPSVPAAQGPRSSNNSMGDAFIVRNGREMQIVIGRIETFDMGSAINRSTCGFIRSEALPGIRMTAMSGWSGTPKSTLALDPVKYTQLVREVAAQLGFVLPADRWDNGNRGPPTAEQIGRFRACHIEKKLSVWWVRKILKAVFGTKDMTRMGEIKSIVTQLPEEYRSAIICLNHDPCGHIGGCLPWLDLIKAETGICFRTERIRTFVDDERKDAPFRFGDDDMEDPVSRSATNPGPRTKCSESKEKGGLLWAGAPKTVGPLRSSFDAINISSVSDSFERPSSTLRSLPKESSPWNIYRGIGDVIVAKPGHTR
ncbi:hypothetical protein B0T14DRAFT_602205, partial [Immersiella caudata]